MPHCEKVDGTDEAGYDGCGLLANPDDYYRVRVPGGSVVTFWFCSSHRGALKSDLDGIAVFEIVSVPDGN